MALIVLKFGGTSVKDAAAMRQAAEIVMQRSGVGRVVVLSAAAGVTNELLKAARLSGEGETDEAAAVIASIERRHLQMCAELLPQTEMQQTSLKIKELITRLRVFCDGILLLRECTLRSLDCVASFGELLTTTIFTVYLTTRGHNSVFCDARGFMRTDSEFTAAKPDFGTIEKLVRHQVTEAALTGQVVITQGFIGANSEGTTTTLGRGGSDFSAAIIGAAAGADEIQIWTDVSGIFSADPNRVPEATSLAQITFEEARQLAFYGAKVLHPETILPAVQQNIPVRVMNTFAPLHSGTLITLETEAESPKIRAVSVKKDCILLSAAIIAGASEIQAEFHAGFLRGIARTGLPLLLFAGGESRGFAVVECASVFAAESVIALQLPLASVEECAVLCACGPNIAIAGEIQAGLSAGFASVAHKYGAVSVLTAASGTSAYLAVLPRKMADSALPAAHGLVCN